jgi:hypothetical protein
MKVLGESFSTCSEGAHGFARRRALHTLIVEVCSDIGATYFSVTYAVFLLSYRLLTQVSGDRGAFLTLAYHVVSSAGGERPWDEKSVARRGQGL